MWQYVIESAGNAPARLLSWQVSTSGVTPLLRTTRIRLASAVTLVIASVARADAYIDPGTGSMLLQMLGAAVAGGIFYFHELRSKIMALFSRRSAAPADTGEQQAADDPLR